MITIPQIITCKRVLIDSRAIVIPAPIVKKFGQIRFDFGIELAQIIGEIRGICSIAVFEIKRSENGILNGIENCFRFLGF